MPADPCTLAFHIGAHKTATTHLQWSFRNAADKLALQGVRYYGPQDFRLPGRSIFALFGLKERNLGQTRRTPTAQFELMRKDAHRVLFSEENYIGVLNSPRRYPVTVRYPFAAEHLSKLAAAIGQPIDVFLSIRRPTAFLNSAFCQQLMGGRIVPFARYATINPLQSVDWFNLVRRLRAAEGVNMLTVWCYEDYRAVFPRVCAAMIGADAARLVRPLRQRLHEGLSAPAVAEMLQRDPQDRTEKLGFKMRKLMPVGAEYPAFDGFDAATHAAGDAAYARQMAGIAALPGVTLLRPDNVGPDNL